MAVRLLFDENLATRLVRAFADVFPGSEHVEDALGRGASDESIWTHALALDLLTITKDEDFQRLSGEVVARFLKHASHSTDSRSGTTAISAGSAPILASAGSTNFDHDSAEPWDIQPPCYVDEDPLLHDFRQLTTAPLNAAAERDHSAQPRHRCEERSVLENVVARAEALLL